MKTTIIEGKEYKLTPIKKENKTVALFILTMPKNNSWNGKWTGEGYLYAYSQVAFRRGKPIYPNLKEGNFYYDFGDGWVANVEVRYVTPSESKKIMRKSKGFCGYTWMCDEIMKLGRIRTVTERRAGNVPTT